MKAVFTCFKAVPAVPKSGCRRCSSKKTDEPTKRWVIMVKIRALPCILSFNITPQIKQLAITFCVPNLTAPGLTASYGTTSLKLLKYCTLSLVHSEIRSSTKLCVWISVSFYARKTHLHEFTIINKHALNTTRICDTSSIFTHPWFILTDVYWVIETRSCKLQQHPGWHGHLHWTTKGHPWSPNYPHYRSP